MEFANLGCRNSLKNPIRHGYKEPLDHYLAAYTKRASTESPPDIDALLYFYPADLGPTNIMVSGDDGVITAIMDWNPKLIIYDSG